MDTRKINKMLLTGGGTGGSVSPLLAIVDEIRAREEEVGNCEFAWIGTRKGIERGMVERENIRFKWIFSGKMRRYFSFMNFIDPIFILMGAVQVFFIMLFWRPKIVLTAGSFVSVPVVWAAWLLRIPVLVHQQDVRPGLANVLMAPFARVVTVVFEKSMIDYGQKAVWTGNPVRSNFVNIKTTKNEAIDSLGVSAERPVVLVMGGGTGAEGVNKLVADSRKTLEGACSIIHITGSNKLIPRTTSSGYKSFEFLDTARLIEVLVTADVVVSRAGMGALTDLSFLEKPSILIPMPDSHQEENVIPFRENDAAMILDQKELTSENFADEILGLLKNQEKQGRYKQNMSKVMKTGANKKILEIIKKQGRL